MMNDQTRRRTEYDSFRVKPLAGAGGAEVIGFDASRTGTSAMRRDLQQALQDHILLFIRDQKLTDPEFEAFAETFGTLTPHPFVTPVDNHPNMISVERAPDDDRSVRIVGEDWHADAPWKDEPVSISLLYNLEAPLWGGDTQFTNLYLAYDDLSDGLKAMIEPLMLRHAAAGGASYLTSIQSTKGMHYDLSTDIDRVGSHPLVRIHPETGKPILAISGPYNVQFDGWTAEESRPVLDLLLRLATKVEHTFRVRWETGTLAVWDNRCTLHQAIKDYQGFGRRMRRLQIAGDRPFGPARPAPDRALADA